MGVTPWTDWHAIWVLSGVPDIITHAKFCVSRLRGFSVAALPKVPIPILFSNDLYKLCTTMQLWWSEWNVRLERVVSGQFSPLPLCDLAVRSCSVVFCHYRSTLCSTPPDFRPAPLHFLLCCHALATEILFGWSGKWFLVTWFGWPYGSPFNNIFALPCETWKCSSHTCYHWVVKRE